MDLIPHDDLKLGHPFNLAPMIDFLFLMLALFATLAMSRAALFDSDISLASVNGNEKASTASAKHQINICISANGQYKWLTEFQEYPMENTEAIRQEIIHQHQIGALPPDKKMTEVLLHIDQRAPWKMIAEAIFSIRETGFAVHPVYENGASR